MKRILKVAFWVLFIAFDIAAALSFLNTREHGQYTVDTEQFDSVVEHGDDLDVSGIKIIDNRLFGRVETILTEDMIIGIEDTDVPGQKRVIFEHNNKQFSFTYDVKYRIELVSDGKVIDTQMVFLPDELDLPTPEAKDGYAFSHWDYDFSKGFSDNVTINAVFEKLPHPKLEVLTATYGDTLGDITLPSDEFGGWQFVYPADTPVGNAGKQSFSVKYVYNNDEGYYDYDTVYVDVVKKELSFTVLDTSFVYDGSAHYPAYKLDEEVAVVTLGAPGTDVGKYEYGFVIEDANYFGEISGSFEITKASVTVTVSSAEIVYPAAVPEFTYTVEGFENVSILGIKINAPEYASAARVYDIIAQGDNANVDFTFVHGTLTVHKGNAEVEPPTVATAIFEDRLGDVAFEGKYLGTWEWEDPDTVVDSMDGITAWAIFTHNDPNYNPTRVEVSVTNVEKKTLSITVDKTEFTYIEGVGHTLAYTLSGSIDPAVYESLQIVGNEPMYLAGKYVVTLSVSDTRYKGDATFEVEVLKADPKPDFSIEIGTTWTKGLTLSCIALPEGFAWDEPTLSVNAGTHYYSVTFTPADTDNYNTVTALLKVVIAKVQPEVVGVKPLYEKVYDTEEYDISKLISAYDTDGKVSVEYYKDGEKVDAAVGAGTYSIVIILSEGTNHLGREFDAQVKITPATNTQQVADNQTATYGDSTDKLTLPEAAEGKWSWAEETVGPVGTKQLTAVYYDENGNYEPRTVYVTVTVSKKSLDIPTFPAVQQYTGEPLSTGLSNTDEYTVSGDLTATVVGTYSVTFTLTDKDNCEWRADKNAESITRTYKISMAPNAWTAAPENIVTEYTGDPVTVVAVPQHGTVSVEYYLNGIKVDAPVEVGVYNVIIIVTDPNYDTLDEEKTVEITPATVPLPTVGNLVYNGQEQGISISDENLGDLYVIDSEQKATDAGQTAYVVLKLSDEHNYKWAGTADKTVTISRTVAKATVTISGGTTISKDKWEFNETPGVVTKAAIDSVYAAWGADTKLLFSTDNVNFIYESYDALPKSGAHVKAGKYYVKTVVEASDNWNYSETSTLVFDIEQAKPDAITVLWNAEHMADGLYYENLLKIDSYEVSSNGEVIEARIDSWQICAERGFLAENTVYVFKLTPTADTENYTSATVELKVSLKTVAKVVKDGVEKPYGSIESALANAVSGSEVWVTPDASTNVQIRENVTVSAGVRLILPYLVNENEEINSFAEDGAAVAVFHNSNSSKVPAAERNPMGADAVATDELCTTRVIVCEGVRITVIGELFIAGQLDGGGGAAKYSGQTAGYHARVILKDGAVIDIRPGATMQLLGFVIDESTEENPAKVELYGTMMQPFVVRDHKGGSITAAAYYGMSSYKYSSFNQFQLMNLEAHLTVYSSGKIAISGNMYANEQHNSCFGKFVGNTSDCFIQLSEGSRLEAKFDPETGDHTIRIRGGARTNYFSLNAAGHIISSGEFYFPICWGFDITLDTIDDEGEIPATYYMMQGYKLLPGSKLTVEENVTLNVSFLAIYESFNDLLTGVESYPADLDPARFTVNGVVNAATLGGKVYTDNTDGKVVVKAMSSVTATTYEISAVNSAGYFSSVKERQELKWALELYNTDGTLLATDMYNGIPYYTEGGEWKIPPYFEITVGEGYSVTTSEWLVVDADGNVTTEKGGTSKTFTAGQSVYLLTSGASVTYTLVDSTYVIFENGISAAVSAAGKGGTYTIRSPLIVNKVPTVSVNNKASATYTTTFVDANVDGYCEVSVEIKTESTCLQYLHFTSATKFKVNVNGEKDENGNLVYVNGDVVMCSNHSNKVSACTYLDVVYADNDGNVTIDIQKA